MVHGGVTDVLLTNQVARQNSPPSPFLDPCGSQRRATPSQGSPTSSMRQVAGGAVIRAPPPPLQPFPALTVGWRGGSGAGGGGGEDCAAGEAGGRGGGEGRARRRAR